MMKKLYILLVVLFMINSGTAQSQLPDLTDYDGNVYDTVIIGDQVWMAENLRVTHYRNGVPITNVTDNIAWGNLTTGARCYYNNDSVAFDSVYGALYNWYAVHDANGLCPEGWDVPTDADWSTVEFFLGGSMIAGGKMKEEGTLHWLPPNAGATNSSGFTGLPGGFRGLNDEYEYIQENGLWWTSTANGTTNAWSRYLWYMNAGVDRNAIPKKMGFSIRCIKVDQVGIGVNHFNRFKLYPVPASTFTSIESPTRGHLSILTLSGQVVLQQEITEPTTTIDISGLKSGIYVVRLIGENEVQVGKIVRQ